MVRRRRLCAHSARGRIYRQRERDPDRSRTNITAQPGERRGANKGRLAPAVSLGVDVARSLGIKASSRHRRDRLLSDPRPHSVVNVAFFSHPRRDVYWRKRHDRVVVAVGRPELLAIECNAAWFERKRAKGLDRRCISVDAETIEATVAPRFVDGHEVKRTVDDRHTNRAPLQLHFAQRGTAFVKFDEFLIPGLREIERSVCIGDKRSGLIRTCETLCKSRVRLKSIDVTVIALQIWFVDRRRQDQPKIRTGIRDAQRVGWPNELALNAPRLQINRIQTAIRDARQPDRRAVPRKALRTLHRGSVSRESTHQQFKLSRDAHDLPDRARSPAKHNDRSCGAAHVEITATRSRHTSEGKSGWERQRCTMIVRLPRRCLYLVALK